jgi:transcriptional regulator with XRE-family HTH domain
MLVRNRIRQLRAERNMTQAGLAVAARTTLAYVGFIERDGHMPGPDLRRRIARALDADEREVWPDCVPGA